MSNSGGSRLVILAVILGIIVLVHVIVISCVVKSSAPEKTPVADVPAETAKPAQEKKQETPGFWERLFGSAKSPAPAAPAAQPEKEQKPREVQKQYRYRVPSKNKLTGQPFRFLYTRRGTLPAHAVPGDTSRSGILVDMDTRRVLWEKDSNKKVPIASMSKMMTLLLAMEHLENTPDLSLDSPIKISRDVLKVPRTGVVWLDPRETFKYSELLMCAAVKSANDAASQLAITVSGSEQDFAAAMNKRAAELKMFNSNFINPHGLPDKKNHKDSVSTAHDMVILGEKLLEYPQLMEYFSTQQASIREGDNRTVIVNTNRLINPRYPGVDGMKTGFTKAAGFCLTFSAERNGRRIMGCVTGFATAKERDAFCRKLVDWAFGDCKDLGNKEQVSKKASSVSQKRVQKKNASARKKR